LLSLIRIIKAFKEIIHVTYHQNKKQVEIGPAPADIISLAIARFVVSKVEARQ
jgi:hypothetical protein